MPYTHDLMLVLIFIVSGLAAGYIGGLLGVGGGTILVPIFLTIFSFTSQSHDTIMHSAIATSLGLVIPTGIAASYKQLKEKTLTLTTSVVMGPVYFYWCFSWRGHYEHSLYPCA